MNRHLLVLGLAALPWVAWGQAGAPQTDDQKAAYGQVAFEDMTFLTVLLDLGVGKAQAGQLLVPFRTLAARLAQIDGALNAPGADVLRQMQLKRDGLLAGKPVPADQLTALQRYQVMAAALEDERQIAYDETYEAVLALFSPAQKALVAAPTTTPAAEDQAAAQKRRQALAQRERAVQATVERLMEQARATIDPARRSLIAPGITAGVAELTGLDAQSPLFAQLNQLFLTRIGQYYNLQPLDAARTGATIARELTLATLQVLDQKDQGNTAAPTTKPVSPERLRQAVRYPRAVPLLDAWSKRTPQG